MLREQIVKWEGRLRAGNFEEPRETFMGQMEG